MHGFLFINKRLFISFDTGIYAIMSNDNNHDVETSKNVSDGYDMSRDARKPGFGIFDQV